MENFCFIESVFFDPNRIPPSLYTTVLSRPILKYIILLSALIEMNIQLTNHTNSILVEITVFKRLILDIKVFSSELCHRVFIESVKCVIDSKNLRTLSECTSILVNFFHFKFLILKFTYSYMYSHSVVFRLNENKNTYIYRIIYTYYLTKI